MQFKLEQPRQPEAQAQAWKPLRLSRGSLTQAPSQAPGRLQVDLNNSDGKASEKARARALPVAAWPGSESA